MRTLFADPHLRQTDPTFLGDFENKVLGFSFFGKQTEKNEFLSEDSNRGFVKIPIYKNEFWTSKQRAAHSLHEIAYRACFKPQLTRFFISELSRPGDIVYDPFMGRGTTLLEAGLLGRVPFGCDVNPLSRILIEPRLLPPPISAVQKRLFEMDMNIKTPTQKELLVFFHQKTLKEISALRRYLAKKTRSGTMDNVDRWIQMIAVNRLTGHSKGFFSVYTMPPNQAVTVEVQKKINAKKKQKPEYRDIRNLILRKSVSLLRNLDESSAQTLRAAAKKAVLLTKTSDKTHEIPSGSVSLVVTSPPFLDVVDYSADNWMRCWFCGIDIRQVPITIAKKLGDWQEEMRKVMVELKRVLKNGGFVAFEVGEVRGGKIKLEEPVIAAGISAGLKPKMVIINSQLFTKTSNCWGVENNTQGTNSNRIVLFTK